LERRIIENSKPHCLPLVHSLGIDLSLDLYFFIFLPASPAGSFLEENQFWFLPISFFSMSPFLPLSLSVSFSLSHFLLFLVGQMVENLKPHFS
jgi:hypothetical protein